MVPVALQRHARVESSLYVVFHGLSILHLCYLVPYRCLFIRPLMDIHRQFRNLETVRCMDLACRTRKSGSSSKGAKKMRKSSHACPSNRLTVDKSGAPPRDPSIGTRRPVFVGDDTYFIERGCRCYRHVEDGHNPSCPSLCNAPLPPPPPPGLVRLRYPFESLKGRREYSCRGIGRGYQLSWITLPL